MKKILNILFIIILLSSFSYSINYVAGDDATLYGSCILANGSFGGDNMTISIFYPNTTKYVDSALMNEYNTGLYNYTFTIPNITGTYPYSMVCYADEESISGSDEFIVLNVSASDYIDIDTSLDVDNLGLTFLLISLVVVFFVVGFMSNKLTDNNVLQKIIKFIFINVGLWLIPTSLGLFIKIMEDSLIYPLLETIFIVVQWLVFIIIFGNILINIWGIFPIMWGYAKKFFNKM